MRVDASRALRIRTEMFLMLRKQMEMLLAQEQAERSAAPRRGNGNELRRARSSRLH